MGKAPVRLKEVVYTLSPFQQNVMGGLWKDIPHKASHYFEMVWLIDFFTSGCFTFTDVASLFASVVVSVFLNFLEFKTVYEWIYHRCFYMNDRFPILSIIYFDVSETWVLIVLLVVFHSSMHIGSSQGHGILLLLSLFLMILNLPL